MVGGQLGCGTYEAYFKSRGGDVFICRALNITSLTWGRRLNDVSEASITVAMNGEDGECCSCIGQIDPWKHELSIYRDGAEVWCGPVIGGEINQAQSTARFDARDLSAWFDRRWVEVKDTNVEFEEADVTDVYNWLMTHGYYKDPFNLDWYFTGPVNVPIDRTYLCYDPSTGERWGGNYPYIGDELRELRKSGIDSTVVRRTYIAGQITNGATQGRLTDSSFIEPPTLIIVGNGMATEVGVGGGAGGFNGWFDDQIWIEKPFDQDRADYGLLQHWEAAPDLDDVESTTALPNPIAQRAFALRELKKKPFIYIKNGSLTQSAPITIDELIPGRHLRVDLLKSCRPVESDYMISSVSVDFSAQGEKVNLELTPPGAEQLKG